ncbi:MAG: putative transcriptional regulator [Chlamydiales bacterium]|jgi:putative transcriptional regulator
MVNLPHADLRKGTLLIATPDIDAGMFFRSVILVCEHSVNGSFGIVINKNLDLELPDEILNMNQLANPRVGLRAGGPVQTNQMMILHVSGQIPENTLEICTGVYLGGDLQFLQSVVTDDDGPEVLLCFGYAGWGGGQLEREFLDGSWLLAQGDIDSIFRTPVEKLWQVLLREMGGKYATLSMIPEDLTLN